MFLFFILSLRTMMNIINPPGALQTTDPVYSFMSGGRYNLTLSSPSYILNFTTSFATRKDLSRLVTFFYNIDDPSFQNETMWKYFDENNIDGTVRFQNVNGSLSIVGSIKSKGMYYLVLLVPKNKNNKFFDRVNYTMFIECSNPNSKLGYDQYPMIYTLVIFAGLIGLLLVAWVINWLRFVTWTNYLNFYFMATFCLTLAFYIVYSLEIWHKHNSDDPTILEYVRIALRINEIFIFNIILLVCKGWKVVRNSLSIWEHLYTFVISAGFVIPLIVLEAETLQRPMWVKILLVVLMGASAGIFYVIMFIGVRDANEIVKAHMIVISESGIDPNTTPIAKKFSLFRSVSVASSIFFILVIIRSVILVILPIEKWILQLIYDILYTTLLYAAAWIFRLKKETASGYIEIEGINESQEETREFTVDEIENRRDLTFEGEQWDGSAPLPPQPFVIRRKNERRSNNNSSAADEKIDDEIL